MTTGGTAQDWLAVAMLLTPAGGKGKNALQNNITDTPNNKKTPTEADTYNNKKPDENASVKKKITTFDTEHQNKKGEAYAEGGDAPIKSPEFDKVTLPDGTTVKRLKPNMEYQVNGYTYKTDSQGRIKEVSGTLRQGQGKRSNYHQRTVGKNDGRLDTDQGGHLIGNQFDGSGGKENLVPMDKDVNNYHKGKWGQMEKNWAEKIKEGKQVDVKIEPNLYR